MGMEISLLTVENYVIFIYHRFVCELLLK